MNERMKFVSRLEDGEKMTGLCREFGVSRKTGYKVHNRYKESGLIALYDQKKGPQENILVKIFRLKARFIIF